MALSRRFGRTDMRSPDLDGIAALPDKLAAVTLDLQRLSYYEGPRIGPHAVSAITNCCDRLNSLMVDALRMVQYVVACSNSDDSRIGGMYRSVASYHPTDDD